MKHEKTSDLMEKRIGLLDAMKTAHTADEGAKFKSLETELRALDSKIARQKMLDDADRAEPGTPIHGDAKLSNEIRSRFSLGRAIAHAAGLNVDAGFEKEIQDELAKRAGKPAQGIYIPTEIFEKRVSTTSTASEIVPTDFRPELFINALTANTVIRSLGATVLNGLRGNVSIPREMGSPQVGWVAENSALGSGDPDFDSVTLSPKHCGVISEYSRNMIQQSSPDVEGLLRKMMARNIALAIDSAAIRGGGSNEPVGILGGMSGIQTVAVTDLFTAAATAVSLAAVANVGGSPSFLTTPLVRKIAALAMDKQNNPLGVSAVFGGQPITFSNIETADGNSPSTYALIYADWSELVLGIWSELDILVNPYESTAYSKGNVSLRAMATVDVACRNGAAFVSVTGVNSATPAMPA
ncbi:MAG: phage major capsid protein [Alphaproteobacteria bacterium]|nr:phage major capsid protein [Alphaproteobacteria bacterium]